MLATQKSLVSFLLFNILFLKIINSVMYSFLCRKISAFFSFAFKLCYCLFCSFSENKILSSDFILSLFYYFILPFFFRRASQINFLKKMVKIWVSVNLLLENYPRRF